MSTQNRLETLLRTPALERKVSDYEHVFDDFISFAGGGRITDCFTVPNGVRNADYYLDAGDYDLVLELKQISAYRKEKTPDAYFSEPLHQGKIKRYEEVGSGQIRIDPDSLSFSDWNRFYKTFRPSVTGNLDKAAQQLKASRSFLPPPKGRRFYGVFLINTGDYTLSTDLLSRLVEWRVKNKWRRELYSSLDFVACLAIDMVQEERHILHSRHIARTTDDPLLVEAMRRLFDRWVRYGSAALGATVSFNPSAQPPEDPINVQTPVRGNENTSNNVVFTVSHVRTADQRSASGRIRLFRPCDPDTAALDGGTTFNLTHDRGCARRGGLPRLPSGA